MLTALIPFTQIYTPRCIIRKLEMHDAPKMHEALKASFQELKKWMVWAQGLASLRDTEYFIQQSIQEWHQPLKNYNERTLVVMDATNTHFIASIGMTPLELSIPSFEIGYWIDQRLSGQGLMSEAANGLVHYLWDVYFAQRIEIRCEPNNRKSAQLAERLHFPLEAHMKNQRLSADKKSVCDTLLYAISTKQYLPTIEVSWDR